MTIDLFKMFREGNPAGAEEPSEASTAGGSAAAGAQPREGRTARQEPGKERPWKSGDVQMVTLRLRAPIVDAVEQAVRESPIEFGNASDFYRRAIEHELARRGLIKTFK